VPRAACPPVFLWSCVVGWVAQLVDPSYTSRYQTRKACLARLTSPTVMSAPEDHGSLAASVKGIRLQQGPARPLVVGGPLALPLGVACHRAAQSTTLANYRPLWTSSGRTQRHWSQHVASQWRLPGQKSKGYIAVAGWEACLATRIEDVTYFGEFSFCFLPRHYIPHFDNLLDTPRS